jgi:hypothetical protein
MISKIVSSEGMVFIPSMESTASKILREFISFNREQILDAVREHGTALATVKGVKVETPIGIALGHSVGTTKFIYFSPNLGTVGKFVLLFGRTKPSYSFHERIGKRCINIKVYL